MGWFQRVFGGEIDSYDPAQRVLPEPYNPYMGVAVADPGTPLLPALEMHAAEAFWASQPNLRKVVGYIARNVSTIPLHMYERVSDTDRRRVHDDPVAVALRSPQKRLSPSRFWEAIIADGCLYDRWAFLVVPGTDGRATDFVHVPAWRLKFKTDELGRVTEVAYWVGDKNLDESLQWKIIPLEAVVFDHGYAPRTAGLSPVYTLRDVLDEASEAVKWRRQVWDNGTRAPGYLTGGDKMMKDPDKIERLRNQLAASHGRDGNRSGGLPYLGDLQIHETKIFSPQELQDIQGRQLTGVEVATAFHIAPELIGAREGTYSNVQAFRQMAYRDNLGPYIKNLEDALNAQLLPPDSDRYIEANVDVKLRGSFEEQAKVKQAAVGGPWLTRNEARAMENRPPIEGGDELITPLNVVEGGQANPQDSGTQNEQ
ncbi:phage portal protein [Naumannella halotolerans]|uniref:HK97 family phage portal protein n=1 Tax=Naumannella halotolerans TaxID=993414 RepID=A0A4V3EMS0_9ACTN|nr:phage portal protein [Naumannella halotolerans]TDT31108.1 HK97 family phage portal protein [Naumannella halotolerans]